MPVAPAVPGEEKEHDPGQGRNSRRGEYLAYQKTEQNRLESIAGGEHDEDGEKFEKGHASQGDEKRFLPLTAPGEDPGGKGHEEHQKGDRAQQEKHRFTSDFVQDFVSLC